MKKRRVLSIAVILGILMGVAVFAAQYTSDVVKSKVSAGNLKVDLVIFETVEGKEVPVTGEVTIIPGSDVDRIARVKNTGNGDAWVRVKASLVKGDSTESYADTKDIELIGIDADSWELQDGYWYYKKPLAAGATTEPLFTSVSINANIGNDFDGTNLKIDAEGTQVKNNGSTVFEAEGWTSN